MNELQQSLPITFEILFVYTYIYAYDYSPACSLRKTVDQVIFMLKNFYVKCEA